MPLTLGQKIMIRLGTFEDIPVLDPFDPFGGSREEEVSGKQLYVFENQKDEPIAYISTAGYKFHGYTYVTFLLVHPEYRRRGIATKLLDHVEALHSGERIFISTESDNEEMLELLERQRYQHSGSLAGLNLDGAGEVFFFKDL